MADKLDTIRARGRLLVGVTEASPPFSFRDGEKGVVGYDVDLAAAVAERLGVPMEKVVLLNKERIPALQSDRVDIVASGMTRSAGRLEEIDFSIDYMVSPHRVIARKDGPLKTYRDLAGRTLALVQGASVVDHLRHDIPTIKISFFDHYRAAFDALAAGKVDAFFADGLLLLTYAHQSGRPDDYMLLEGYTDDRTAGFGLKKGEARLTALVNDTLRELEASGQAARIFDKHFAPITRGFTIG